MSENSTMQAEWKNAVSNQHLMQLMDGLDELVMVLSLDGTCTWCNRAFAELLGKTREALSGKAYPLPELRELMVAEPQQTVEVWVASDKGARLLRLSAVSGQDAEGCIESLLIIGRDMTPMHRLQNPLHFMSHGEELLPVTAPQTLARIEHALQRSVRAEEYVVFLALQISGTGPVAATDSYGASLERVANALQHKIRQGDTLARLDSGAYLLVLEQVDCPEAIAAVVDKLSVVLNENQMADQPALMVNIGVAISPDDGYEPLELMDRAQQALQRAIMEDETICYS
ncbi:diguanylate cyclase domain-containing protein [Marinobacterium marinum]|uniref:Diguanylate cyclase n=1 Tax=Marinobacterium marinum TaxID=2756129 RepID=A0A7W1WVV3_9GAMM|nr:diguanylate cyclase [Marinobacterium marinum]MBA4501181.1 diguanylate cyclase [Marinobacterium marinum]